MGTSATMTLHVVQYFDFDSQIAFYFFAVWSTGQTVGNGFASCMIPCVRPIMRIAMVGQVIACSLAGPTNVIP